MDATGNFFSLRIYFFIFCKYHFYHFTFSMGTYYSFTDAYRKKVFGDAEIRLTEEGIFIPGYFSDHRLTWNLVQHFVVRNDYVTITRTNQHYVQLEVLKPLDTGEINNMNTYSERQIELQKQNE